MGCGCGKGNRHVNNTGDLSKFAYLTPRQLKILEQQQAEKEKENQDKKEEE